MELLRKKLIASLELCKRELEPLDAFLKSGSEELASIGKSYLKRKKVGCLLLAGGQATRLGSKSSKALVEVAPFSKQSLLELFCRRVAAASLCYGYAIPVAIMVSPFNHKEILAHLEKGNFFGLKKEQVSLFQQTTLPQLELDLQFAKDEKGELLFAPNGNGYAPCLLVKSGIYQRWKAAHISDVAICSIDNPLGDPFDLELVGLHSKESSDVTCAAIIKEIGEDKVGFFAKSQGKVCIAEYSETLSSEIYPLGNAGIYLFSGDFLEKIEEKELKLHAAKKLGRYKFEAFIFDHFEWADKISVIAFEKEKIFAPLKNSSGKDSLQSVQEAMIRRDALQYEKVTGAAPEKRRFELDRQFYYPTEEMKKRWSAKPLPAGDVIKI